MNILVINTGSSSLKFDLLEVTTKNETHSVFKLAHGAIEKIGSDATLSVHATNGQSTQRNLEIKNYREAAFEALGSMRGLDAVLKVEAVGHRVVHGGEKFNSPTQIDDSVLAALEKLNELAPLHNPGALEAIRATKEILGDTIPMVAVFDTAFHHSIPKHAATYALPRELAERHHIRRYGFHGIAHESMLQHYAELTGTPIHRANIITFQLGNGCSITAIQNGKSIDTSMGFTPLEGLVMGTRSGDIDPGLPGFLARREKMSAENLEDLLNHRSGLLGLCGWRDMRDIFAARKSDEHCALAIEIFCYRARKYLGAYLAAMGGAEAIVFGGGIGENLPEIRSRICDNMNWCGLKIEAAKNLAAIGTASKISADDSTMQAWVIPVDESKLIAEATIRTLAASRRIRD